LPNSKATVSGDFSDLIKGAQNAAKNIADLGLKMSGIATAAKGFDVASSAVGDLINGLGKIGLAASGIEAIGKSTVSMGMALLKGNANLEMTTISFQTLLGSASAAQDMIKQLTDFAASTPFELTGLESNTQRLLAFGFSAKDIIPLMTSMGDAISALGGTQDNLNSLVYVMGQMRQEAHINAGDIMQMVNLGIPALQMLADHYGKTTSEIQEMITKGLIPGKDAVAIFSQSLEKQYGGMMKAQSSTFSGMISNLQDWANSTMIILTKPLFEPAKKALAALLNYVQSPAGIAAVNKLAAYIQEGVNRMTAAFVRFEPQIRPMFQHLLQVAEVIRAQMTPGFLTLIPLLGQMWTRVEPMAASFFKFYQAIQPVNIALAALRGYITGGMAGALAALQSRFSMISGYVQIGINAALVEVKKFGPAALSWISETAISIARQTLSWGESLLYWVAPYASRLVSELINLGGQALTWVVGYAPQLANQVLFWGESIVGWILPAIPRLLNTLGEFGTNLLKWVEQEAPSLTAQVIKWTDILAGWIIPAIPGVIAALEQLGATVVNWGLTRLPQLMAQVAIGIGNGFGVNLRPAVNDVLLIFNALVNNIRSTVLPAFEQMVGFLASNVEPLLNRLAGFIASTVIPTVASLAAFTMDVLVPAFVRAADALGSLFGPSLTLIGSLIRNELLPSLTDSWNYFDGKYNPTVQSLAQKLGGDLASGIQTAVDKFKAALPTLESFYQKIEPIAVKALELYQALSPLSIGFDVLKGILTGGLEGGLTAFETHVTNAGKVFGLDLQPAINTFNTFLNQSLLPTLKDVIKWVGDYLVPTVLTLGKTFFTDVLPRIMDFAKSVGDTLMPIIRGMGDFFEKHIIPLAQSLAATFEKDVLPAFGRFGNFLAEKVFPALGDLVDWVSAKIVPVIGDLVKVILDKVVPTLFSWWQVIASFLQPIIESIANFIVNDFIPNFSKLADAINKNVLPVLKTVAGFLGGTFGVVIGLVGKIIGSLVDIIGRLVGAMDGIIHLDFGKAWDSLTGKTNVASDATKDLLKQNDDLFNQLKNTGKNTLAITGGSFESFTKSLLGGKSATDDLTSAHNALAKQLQDQSAKAYSDAQKASDDLAQKYKEGKISADQYHQGISDINDKLADFQKQMDAATQRLAQGKTPVDDYKKSIDGLTGSLDGSNKNTMESSKSQIDALTKKYLDGKGTFDDYQKALNEISGKLNGEGKTAVENARLKMDDLNKKYVDGKLSLDDYKKGYDLIVGVMENEGKSAQEKAKDRLSDLNTKYMDGKISFDDYKKGIDDVNKSLDTYNKTQLKDLTIKTNFRDVANDINDLITNAQKLTKGQLPGWVYYAPPKPVQDYPAHAAGTMNAPGGLSLVGERGMELIQSAGKFFLATRPMLLNLAHGAQVYNNQQTMQMLPNPASAQQISNMYQTSNANRSWDNSQTNSNNSQVNSGNTYYINGQPASRWSFSQQMRWAGAR
jgi:tape measure domain-containing protein